MLCKNPKCKQINRGKNGFSAGDLITVSVFQQGTRYLFLKLLINTIGKYLKLKIFCFSCRFFKNVFVKYSYLNIIRKFSMRIWDIQTLMTLIKRIFGYSFYCFEIPKVLSYKFFSVYKSNKHFLMIYVCFIHLCIFNFVVMPSYQ